MQNGLDEGRKKALAGGRRGCGPEVGGGGKKKGVAIYKD